MTSGQPPQEAEGINPTGLQQPETSVPSSPNAEQGTGTLLTPARPTRPAPGARPAGAPAVHRGPVAPKAITKPDAVMELLLKEVFAGFNAEFGYAVDEVSIVVPRERIVEACHLAKTDSRTKFDYLRCLAVTEYPEYFQVAYLLYSISLKHRAILKANAPKEAPEVPSVTSVWQGADWHEREGAELFGIKFKGHPDPRHLLLFEEFDGKYPMRKDYPYEEIVEWTPAREAIWVDHK